MADAAALRRGGSLPVDVARNAPVMPMFVVGMAQLVADYRGAFVTAAGDFEVAANAISRSVKPVRAVRASLETRSRVVFEPLEDEEGLTVDRDVAVIDFGREVDVLGAGRGSHALHGVRELRFCGHRDSRCLLGLLAAELSRSHSDWITRSPAADRA